MQIHIQLVVSLFTFLFLNSSRFVGMLCLYPATCLTLVIRYLSVFERCLSVCLQFLVMSVCLQCLLMSVSLSLFVCIPVQMSLAIASCLSLLYFLCLFLLLYPFIGGFLFVCWKIVIFYSFQFSWLRYLFHSSQSALG